MFCFSSLFPFFSCLHSFSITAADIVVVDPMHRRKGVGSMLMRWGLDKAENSETDAYIVATDVGRDMYLTVGFQDVFRFWTGADYNWLMVWRR